jgi:RimJ/RimL family protein N-acetyltransferase
MNQPATPAAASFDKAGLQPIPIADISGEVIGRLVPITAANCDDPVIAEKLTDWRREFRTAFFTQFEPTVDRTRAWIRSELVERNDRVWFMIETTSGEFIGHCGLTNIKAGREADADGIVRGVLAHPRNFMFLGMQALLGWCFDTLGTGLVRVLVFKGNVRSVNLFARLGFELVREIALRRDDTEGMTIYVPDAGATDSLAVELQLTREASAEASAPAADTPGANR